MEWLKKHDFERVEFAGLLSKNSLVLIARNVLVLPVQYSEQLVKNLQKA
jgi:hypothetical protein